MTEAETERTLHEIIDSAQKAGADHVAVFIESKRESTIRFAENSSTNNEETESLGIILVLSVDRREGIQTFTGDPRDVDWGEFTGRLVETATTSPVNEEFFPPVSGGEYEEVKTWFRATAELTSEDRASIVAEICEMAESKDVLLFGNLNVSDKFTAAANSAGLYVTGNSTQVMLPITARTKSGNGSGKFTVGHRNWELCDYKEGAKKAIETAIMSKNPQKIAPGEYTVILSPQAIQDYSTFLYTVLDAKTAEEGMSFFSLKGGKGTKIGQKLFGDNVTFQSIFNDPRLPELPFGFSYGSGGSSVASYFSFGMPMKNTTWIENGVLKNLSYSPYWAIKNGIEPTGSPINLIMTGEDRSVEELIAQTDKGVFISSFWYTGLTDLNTLSVTGLTRDGTFLIENGEITVPLLNFRFNDSLERNLNNISGLSRQELAFGEYIPGIMPHVRIEKFRLTSVSEAV